MKQFLANNLEVRLEITIGTFLGMKTVCVTILQSTLETHQARPWCHWIHRTRCEMVNLPTPRVHSFSKCLIRPYKETNRYVTSGGGRLTSHDCLSALWTTRCNHSKSRKTSWRQTRALDEAKHNTFVLYQVGISISSFSLISNYTPFYDYSILAKRTNISPT